MSYYTKKLHSLSYIIAVLCTLICLHVIILLYIWDYLSKGFSNGDILVIIKSDKVNADKHQ